MEKDIVFGDMVWGSCQYDSAGDTYHKILNGCKPREKWGSRDRRAPNRCTGPMRYSFKRPSNGLERGPKNANRFYLPPLIPRFLLKIKGVCLGNNS